MKYQVPQFIEVEDKIFGPLTLKQFIYIVGGAGLSVILYLFLPLFISIILIIVIMTFSLALAFYKINNKPFIFLIESAIKYIFGTKLYIWKREQKPVTEAQTSEKDFETTAFIPKLSDSKLRELTWTLDTKE